MALKQKQNSNSAFECAVAARDWEAALQWAPAFLDSLTAEQGAVWQRCLMVAVLEREQVLHELNRINCARKNSEKLNRYLRGC